jgi:hypothetical protein
MEINPLPKSSITQAVPSASTAVAEPPKPAPAAKPAAAKPPAAKAPDRQSPEPKKEVAAAAAATAGTKTEITDVKPTGEANAEGDPTFTLKVNGKEYKATQSEIIALAQKARGAELAMKQKAEIEKLASDMLTNFDNDTYGLLVKRHGPEKAKAIAIGMVKNLIAQEAKDPKDVEIETLRAQVEEKKAAEERAKKESEDAARRVKQQALYKQMLTEIDAELNQTHLPKDKLTLTRVLNYLAAGKKANGTAWTVREAVKAVEVEDMSHASYYAKRYVEGKLPSEKFAEIFGADALKKLNKEQINLLRNADKIAKNGASTQSESVATVETDRRPRSLSKTKGAEGMSEREYRKKFGSLGGI